ncbi:acyl-CoA dehydrogenase family protein [Haliangium ochraceum]|uniref:Acyl-CoA dehydrogenase domain protein n=1 Tax=Haliangium ochraceum (strain DSM 14365 / JCM 11303 / SMP-2) TaxID=502025 RepID=D0LPU9_HALO1|nr:acyl-CoA dehydrogenase family protein [Haliangium ochraceum]ACY15462.1 acyl-CoA dehydrogenase domain protein [Haliangium ochraceum DSM 14365]
MVTLSNEQAAWREEFRAYVDTEVIPFADAWHRDQQMPPSVIGTLAERGYLGLVIPEEFGGRGVGPVALGLLAGELGRGCSSLCSLLTVHTMVGWAITRWGSAPQKKRWLPELASGRVLGALALTEPDTGSDAKSVRTSVQRHGTELALDGHKSWVTYGQSADLFLVFGRAEEGPAAVLVERDRKGLRTEPISDLLGLRASMTASLRLEGARVPTDAELGRPGMGIAQIAATALDSGRYTVAWGCVGILRACTEACVAYSAQREQFGAKLKDHQLISRMVSNMFTDLRAAELLCLEAGQLRARKDPGALAATSIAKYFASTAAVRAANDAVQLHGANGCSGDFPLQRYFGDAKVMEIIEGSSQIQQLVIAEFAHQDHAGAQVRGGSAAWRRQ